MLVELFRLLGFGFLALSVASFAANDAMFNPNAPAVVETWVRWAQFGLFLSGAGLVVITKGFK